MKTITYDRDSSEKDCGYIVKILSLKNMIKILF